MKKLLSAALLAVSLASAHAGVIPVTNGNFEDGSSGVTDPPGYVLGGSTVNVTNFTISGGQYNGFVLGSHGSSNDTDEAIFRSDGTSEGNLSSGALTTIVAGNNYTLSIDIGTDVGLYDGAPTSGNVMLELFGNDKTTAAASFLALSSALPPNVGVNGTRVSYGQLTYSVTLTAAEISSLNLAGQSLYFSAVGVGAGQEEFDNVTLVSTSAVPEPGTWAMLLGGLCSLVAVQRMRRTQKS